MPNIGIYKITSPTNRIYIGQSVNIGKRWNYHKGVFCKEQPKLYNSLKKHGWENHTKEVIETCLLEQLNEKETYWKQYYLDQVNGDWSKVLFCDLHDNGAGPRSEETKKKISESTSVSVYQYDLQGNFIKEWKSGKEASIYLNISNGWVNKSANSNGDLTFHNFRFTKTKHNKLQPITKWFDKKKPVIQCDIMGNIICEFESAKEASICLNIAIQHITACCRGERKTTHNYKFNYKN